MAGEQLHRVACAGGGVQRGVRCVSERESSKPRPRLEKSISNTSELADGVHTVTYMYTRIVPGASTPGRISRTDVSRYDAPDSGSLVPPRKRTRDAFPAPASALATSARFAGESS